MAYRRSSQAQQTRHLESTHATAAIRFLVLPGERHRVEGDLGNLGRVGLVHAAACTDTARKAPGQQQRRRGISWAPRESQGP